MTRIIKVTGSGNLRTWGLASNIAQMQSHIANELRRTGGNVLDVTISESYTDFILYGIGGVLLEGVKLYFTVTFQVPDRENLETVKHNVSVIFNHYLSNIVVNAQDVIATTNASGQQILTDRTIDNTTSDFDKLLDALKKASNTGNEIVRDTTSAVSVPLIFTLGATAIILFLIKR